MLLRVTESADNTGVPMTNPGLSGNPITQSTGCKYTHIALPAHEDPCHFFNKSEMP